MNVVHVQHTRVRRNASSLTNPGGVEVLMLTLDSLLPQDRCALSSEQTQTATSEQERWLLRRLRECVLHDRERNDVIRFEVLIHQEAFAVFRHIVREEIGR